MAVVLTLKINTAAISNAPTPMPGWFYVVQPFMGASCYSLQSFPLLNGGPVNPFWAPRPSQCHVVLLEESADIAAK